MRHHRDDEPKMLATCFLCRGSFQFGNHIYAGRRIPSWDIMICDTCDKGNWDGIVVGHYPHLERHLQEKGINLTINEKGHIHVPKRW